MTSTTTAPTVRASSAPRTTWIGWVDRQLGRVTMYRFVLLALAVLAVYTLVLSLFGQIFYKPLDLVVSLAVVTATTTASTYLGALAFRVTPHLESSLITALILFFLFMPVLAWSNLFAVGLAGVFAGASKFLLAWRGRHVFNPAAIGAVLVAWTTNSAAVWWIESEATFPALAVLALLVLYRTRRVGFALWFLVPAYAMVVKALHDFGTPLSTGLTTALFTYPVVFLAGFMLSEPLTQPPLRWQRAVIGVLVAVLAMQPLYFPDFPIKMSWELALVIGNLLAFLVGQRKGIALTLVGRRALGADLHEWTFAPKRPLVSKPGQYLELSLPHRSDGRGSRRVFSLVSAPGEEQITITTRIPERSSSYKKALAALEPGATVRATGVAGDFLLPRSTDRKVALVAGGIGITPFVSQLRDLARTGAERDVTVVYAGTVAAEMPYLDDLSVVPGVLVTNEAAAPADLPAGWRWLQGRSVDRDLLALAVPDIAERSVFVSGGPGMVAAVRASARHLKAKRVHTDAFTGY
jgi:glycine betaine catabolism B